MSERDALPQGLACAAAIDPLPPERFASALLGTARAWRNALDARLKNLGVGQAGWLAIAILARSDLALSQRALADHLGIEAPSMGAMVDRLAVAGLVTRTACPGDRRIKLVRLTDAGRELHGRVRTEAEAFRASVLAGVDPALLEHVAGLLETVQERIAAACERDIQANPGTGQSPPARA